MRIQHNVMAMNAYRNYSNNTKALSKNLERLSSGYKINRAGDDAAGLAISEKMRAQITGLEAAQKNVKDGISLVNTAEGAMQEVQDMLNRMVYLAQESANGTYDNEVDRLNLQKEMDQLNSEIDRIADSANFNGIKLLDGSLGFNSSAFTVSKGADAAAGEAATDVITTQMAALATNSTGKENQTTATNTILHKSGNAAQAGTFTIDLSQIKATAKDKDTAAKVKVTIETLDIEYTSSTDGANITGKELATGVATALGAGKEFVVANDGTLTQVGKTGYTAAKGDLMYTAKDNGDGTVTFTTSKYHNGTAWVELEDGKPVADVNDAALKDPGFDIKVADSGTTTGAITGNPNVDATNVQIPMKPGETQFGNTFLTIDPSKLTEGMQITIAGETHTIGDDDIKVSDLNMTQNADKLKLMDRITNAFAKNQHVSVGHDAGSVGKLTLSEKVKADGTSNASEEMQEKMSTLDGFKSLVSFTGAGTKASTALTIDPTKISEGDGVTVGDKTYVFTSKADLIGKTSGKVQYLDKADAVTQLTNALTADGYKTAADASDPNKLLIEAKDAKATAGPQVLGKGLTLQIGDTSDPYNQLSVVIGDIHASVLGTGSLSIADQQSAADAVDKIKAAINTISGIRGTLGATSNRLDHTGNNLSVMRENITDAESAIRDTDIAEEMMAYTKNNILVQSAQAMLAQANQVPQGVLQLLQ